MPNVNTKAHVLLRDGFTCRYCGTQLYLAQAIKVLDMHKPGRKHGDAHWETEPLKSSGATVDHIIPEDEGGYDTLDNLVACCVISNSSKGKGQRSILPQSLDKSWDGGSCIFLTLASLYRHHLSKVDEMWLKALRREGILSDEENIQARINKMSFQPSLEDYRASITTQRGRGRGKELVAILEIGERTYNRIDDKGEREKMIFRYADATSVEMVPGLLRRTLVEGKSMMICECTFAPGVKIPDHSHPYEQAGYVVLGKIQITIDGKCFGLEAGDSYCAPFNVPHSVFTLERSVVVDIFSPPREDYRSPRTT